MRYVAPRGTHDLLPPYSGRLDAVLVKIRGVLRRYGFSSVETPVFEASELFSRSIGDETDIVSKEMYTFTDRKGRSLTLRPEGTAGVVRAYIEHSLDQAGVDRLCYIGPMFRYERPQAGRQRQFSQVGVEIFGDPGPEVDAETIDLFMALCHAVGLTGLTVQLNSVGCRECRPTYSAMLTRTLASHAHDLCADCQRRLTKNPLRVLDCKVETCSRIARDVPSIQESLCKDCSTHFERTGQLLTRLSIPFSLNPRLVRGLDYYTRTAFEIHIPGKEGAQNAVGGGGRYDLLVEQLGGKPTPAIGFAIGVERLMSLIESQSVTVPDESSPLVYIAATGDEGRARGLTLASRLRALGVRAILDPTRSPNLGRQFKEANRRQARIVAVLGEDEVASGTVAIKDMQTREQVSVPEAQSASHITEIMSRTVSGS